MSTTPKSREEWASLLMGLNSTFSQEPEKDLAEALDSIMSLQSSNESLRAEVERLQHIAFLIGNIYYYGGFKAETGNERELEALLIAGGFRYRTEDEVLEARKKFPYPEKARQPK